MFDAIVVGTDGSATALQAVREAGDLAGRVGARLLLVGAYPAERSGPAETLEQGMREAGDELEARGVRVDARTEAGDPAEVLIDLAAREEADLIVVGNKGMTGAKRFMLGSVPDKVSHHAPCSVMIVQTT